MTDVDNLYFQGRPKVTRERRVREIGAPLDAPTQTPKEIQNARVDTLYKKLASIINTANAVIPIYAEHARALTIPVDIEATQIRSAVKRKDQGANGTEIRFDLFVDAIENYDNLRSNISIGVAGQLTGSAPLDAIKITNIRYKLENGDLNADELAVFASVALTQYLLYRMQDQFTVTTISSMVAAKDKQGVEIGGQIASTLMSIFISILVDIINEAAFILLSETPSVQGNAISSVTTNTEIPREPPAPLNKMDKLAIRKAGEADYANILEYALNHITTSLDPRYHSWLAYMDSKQIRNRSIQQYQHGPKYSQQEFSLANSLENEPKSATTDTVVTRQVQNSRLDNIRSLITMNPEHICAVEEAASSYDENLLAIAQVMSSKFAGDAICCLVRFFGQFSSKTLQRFKALILIARGFLSERMTLDIAKSLTDVLNYLANGVRDFIVAEIEEWLRDIIDPILDQFLVVDQEDDWELMIRSCPLLDNFIRFMLKAILQVFEKLRALLSSLQLDVFNFTLNSKNRYTDMYETRTFKIILDVIDRVLTAIVNNECLPVEKPRDHALDLGPIVEDLISTQSSHVIVFPQDIIETYFGNMQPIRVAEDDTRPEYSIPTVQDGPIAGNEELILKEILDTCQASVSDADLQRILGANNGTA